MPPLELDEDELEEVIPPEDELLEDELLPVTHIIQELVGILLNVHFGS